MDNNLIKFSVDQQNIYLGQTVASNCNEILFYNAGTNSVNIENLTLQPNQQYLITGNLGELCISNFNVTFNAGVGANNLLVIRKVYV